MNLNLRLDTSDTENSLVTKHTAPGVLPMGITSHRTPDGVTRTTTTSRRLRRRNRGNTTDITGSHNAIRNMGATNRANTPKIIGNPPRTRIIRIRIGMNHPSTTRNMDTRNRMGPLTLRGVTHTNSNIPARSRLTMGLMATRQQHARTALSMDLRTDGCDVSCEPLLDRCRITRCSSFAAFSWRFHFLG
jgi:hypothetical protein